jgi:DivIVA domain-containing protein
MWHGTFGDACGEAGNGAAVTTPPADQKAEQEVRPREGERAPRRFPTSQLTRGERDRMLKEARDVEFPIALRGYDRAAVDRHMEQLNRLIAELEMSASPESAVRHALDEVSEETRELLQRAHTTAEEITARSRAKADDRLQLAEREAGELREAAQREGQDLRETAQREAAGVRQLAAQEATELRETATREAQQLRADAQRDADELRANARRDAEQMMEAAETRARELGRNAESIWRERRRLLGDMRAVADQLIAIDEAEEKRFNHLPTDAPDKQEDATVPS